MIAVREDQCDAMVAALKACGVGNAAEIGEVLPGPHETMRGGVTPKPPHGTPQGGGCFRGEMTGEGLLKES